MREARSRLLGLWLQMAAAVLWGLGGVAAQALFQRHGVAPGWLVAVRMLGGGGLLLAVFRPRFPRRHRLLLAVLAVVGMAGTQYSWYAAIDLTNAATATFIQYGYVAMVAGWQMVRGEVAATPLRLLALVAATAGVVLQAAGQGGLSGLRVEPLGDGLALLSAVLAAFLFLASARLAREHGAAAVTGWGLVLGGLPVLAWARPWAVAPPAAPEAAALVAFVTVGATAMAFWLSLASLRRVSPTEAAVVTTLEPGVAALAAFVFLGVRLEPAQYLGGALVLLAVVLVGRGPGFRGHPPGSPGSAA